jgi:prepilin-type processing-associated H-X9-DG protein
MKARFSKYRKRAFTLIDMMVVVVVLALLVAMLIPMLAAGKRRAMNMNCISIVKGISFSFRIWEVDHNNEYPMSYSTNSGVLVWPVTTNVAEYFRILTNEISTPKLLICPADRKHIPATNWTTDFNNSHISYFLNENANEAYPQEVMLGDDNLAINGVPVKSGFLPLSSYADVSWTAERHGHVGNIGFADGSVAEESSAGLENAFVLSTNGTPFTTNGIVIP